jgi:hypothetical protein
MVEVLGWPGHLSLNLDAAARRMATRTHGERRKFNTLTVIVEATAAKYVVSVSWWPPPHCCWPVSTATR